MLIKAAYYLASSLFCIGIFASITPKSYFTKLLGLAILQSGILVFYISLGKVFGGEIPVYNPKNLSQLYSSPLPHVLMLTAIVVGFATISVGLALILKINKNFDSVEEKEENYD